MLLQNLNNLKVSVEEDGNMQYKLQEGNKNPKRINDKVTKEYK